LAFTSVGLCVGVRYLILHQTTEDAASYVLYNVRLAFHVDLPHSADIARRDTGMAVPRAFACDQLACSCLVMVEFSLWCVTGWPHSL